MQLIICIAVAILGCLAAIEAFPQQATFQRLPYYPPPTQAPSPIRVRRQLSGQFSSNPAGGADAKLGLSQGIGTNDHNFMGSVFAAGNTDKGPVTTGGALNYNINGNGLGLTKEHVPGVRDTFKQSAHANLFNDGKNAVNANVFASQNTLANGFKFERNGGGLEWANKNGHGAAATLSHIPNFGNQLELGGKANLWSSADKSTKLDLNAGASKWLSGPFSNQKTDFGVGMGLTQFFG